jgi:UTP--glucose-1-phosphate uridylyltransferase
MIEVYEREHASCLALLQVTPEEISAYGCAETDDLGGDLRRVRGVVEKPKPDDARSDLAVIGRYVFTPGIFDALDRITPGVGGELQLTDAIALLIDEEPVYGRVFTEGRYDVGQKLDFLRANIEIALDRTDLGPAFGEWLREYVADRWPV